MKLGLPTVIFTPSFYQCIDHFFKECRDNLYKEIQCYFDSPTSLSAPQKCGVKKIRTKILLVDNNAILQYWDYGRIWHVYGITEMGNTDQLDVLYELLERNKYD